MKHSGKWRGSPAPGHDIKRAARHPRFKLHHDVMMQSWELYDLQADPGERRNVLGSEPEMTTLMRRELEAFMQTDIQGEPIGALSPEDVERLKSLGYLQ